MSEKETSRIEAFSDAVFAVAITLLVLDLKVPRAIDHQTPAALLAALREEVPSYIAFVTSFATILIVWVNHHGIFTLVHKVSNAFLFANGLLLLLVTTVPFPTALISEYLGRPGASVAVAIYSGTFVLMDISFNLLWYVAAHRRALVRANVPDENLRKITHYYLLGFPVYLLATGLAFVEPYLSVAICTGLWIFWAVKGAHHQAELAKQNW
jgi:TMEM175 potassium channel family protein